MKITNKIISDIVSELLGEDAVNITLFVKNGTKVSEFEVAKQMKMDLHQARAILYKLFENNILTFERRKDRQKGWYVTYWDFNPENIDHMYVKLLKQKIEKLKERLEKEKNFDFYMCKNACTRMDFEKAFNANFKCPECGELMNPMDNKRTIEFLQEKIAELTKELEEIKNQPKEKKPDIEEKKEQKPKESKKERTTDKKIKKENSKKIEKIKKKKTKEIKKIQKKEKPKIKKIKKKK
ncbi:MAG: hypothetical protein QXE31_05080 [Candidatus Woesearchaeota archaeon]